MAGHSQFKNIMYRKGAQDAKRSKMFTKIVREITAAVRQGLPDPDANARLRFQPQALTDFVNAIPLVNAQSPSSIAVAAALKAMSAARFCWPLVWKKE